MEPGKPDRFERMVRKEQRHDDWGIAVVSAEDVIKLLRNEHAWMRRMVHEEAKKALDDMPFMGDGDVIENILKRLDQRRK